MNRIVFRVSLWIQDWPWTCSTFAPVLQVFTGVYHHALTNVFILFYLCPSKAVLRTFLPLTLDETTVNPITFIVIIWLNHLCFCLLPQKESLCVLSVFNWYIIFVSPLFLSSIYYSRKWVTRRLETLPDHSANEGTVFQTQHLSLEALS